ncbi:hypothetical protein BX600DRAFT_505365 [Xylariales sp. PMI_506]|nr:hypothetical protein BX600DRAFT_505365 [Xylariales sp. PMI_506]
MTRVLPWKRDYAPARSPHATVTPRLAVTPVRRLKSEENDTAVTSRVTTPSSVLPSTGKRSLFKRAGSTSPPPEPLEESFMEEGLDADDRYRMVEDEFNATAQRFTAHLHAVEYQKLKSVAKLQNAQAIQDISRPVVGRMSELVRKKQDRRSRPKKGKAALEAATADTDSDAETTYHGTSLFGLMESPRKKAPTMDIAASIPSSTRAAAGFGRSSPVSSPPRPPTTSRCPGQNSAGQRGIASSTIPRKRAASPSPSTSNRHNGPAQSSDDDSDGALFGFQRRAQMKARNRQRDSIKTGTDV